MKKRVVRHSTLLKTRRVLYVLAGLVWCFVMREISEAWDFSKEALVSYGGSTVLIVLAVYLLIVLMELLVDIEDLD